MRLSFSEYTRAEFSTAHLVCLADPVVDVDARIAVMPLARPQPQLGLKGVGELLRYLLRTKLGPFLHDEYLSSERPHSH